MANCLTMAKYLDVELIVFTGFNYVFSSIARLRGVHDGLFTGQIDAVDTIAATYRVTFDRSGLGTHTVPDYEVLVRPSCYNICLTGGLNSRTVWFFFFSFCAVKKSLFICWYLCFSEQRTQWDDASIGFCTEASDNTFHAKPNDSTQGVVSICYYTCSSGNVHLSESHKAEPCFLPFNVSLSNYISG